VVGRGGARRPPGEQVAHERLKVGAAGLGKLGAASAQERLGLAGGDQVGGHGGVGAVGGAQVPLERAEQRRQSGRAIHALDRSVVKR
jgi:hypothetical protein